jgi:hypothetical protein
MSVVTCRRLGLPMHACMFMYKLLQNMEFHLVTGFGISESFFTNNKDPTQIGQGILQGSSPAGPIYTVSSDVSIAAYKKFAKDSIFIHPISGQDIRGSEIWTKMLWLSGET